MTSTTPPALIPPHIKSYNKGFPHLPSPLKNSNITIRCSSSQHRRFVIYTLAQHSLPTFQIMRARESRRPWRSCRRRCLIGPYCRTGEYGFSEIWSGGSCGALDGAGGMIDMWASGLRPAGQKSIDATVSSPRSSSKAYRICERISCDSR